MYKHAYRSFKSTLLLCTFLFNVTLTNGFAAWLKCYVDLTDTHEIIMNNRITQSADARFPGVRIELKRPDDDHWFDRIDYPSGQATTLMARLKVPNELSEMDVQYVIDILTPGASFVRPNVCDGRRATATHFASPVVFEITGDTTVVELIAGYATGHEAVTLTETLILRRQDAKEL
jgi:hypothetical protein